MSHMRLEAISVVCKRYQTETQDPLRKAESQMFTNTGNFMNSAGNGLNTNLNFFGV